jgi:hypothetical protein
LPERLYICNMKKLFLIAIGLLSIQLANAQKSLLSLDEHDKYIYYQVVDMPGFSADSLTRNAAWFIKTAFPKNTTVQHKAAEVSMADKFLTYTTIIKHESGAIAYTVTIECKDQKYRYWLTDFVLHLTSATGTAPMYPNRALKYRWRKRRISSKKKMLMVT